MSCAKSPNFCHHRAMFGRMFVHLGAGTAKQNCMKQIAGNGTPPYARDRLTLGQETLIVGSKLL
jgi:hypothetical protein